jgi:hypothetical protein
MEGIRMQNTKFSTAYEPKSWQIDTPTNLKDFLSSYGQIALFFINHQIHGVSTHRQFKHLITNILQERFISPLSAGKFGSTSTQKGLKAINLSGPI